jgi:glutathione S-transferase
MDRADEVRMARRYNQDGKTMRLYYHPLSSNSRRVLLTAHHLGLDLELVVVDLSSGEHKTPDYLRLNPNGRVPLLVDGGFHLWESHAIMQYLADKSHQQDIYPRDVSARADVNRWLFWSASHFVPAAACIIRERVSKKILGGSPDPLEIARGEALLSATALVLDRHLAGKQWIALDQLTLADFAIAAPLMHSSAAQLPIMEFKNLAAWFARVQSLDAWTQSSA